MLGDEARRGLDNAGAARQAQEDMARDDVIAQMKRLQAAKLYAKSKQMKTTATLTTTGQRDLPTLSPLMEEGTISNSKARSIAIRTPGDRQVTVGGSSVQVLGS